VACRAPSPAVTVPWWQAALGVLVGLLLAWAVLVAVLWWSRPQDDRLAQALRLLPDLLRLVARLARDRALPFGVRARLWALLAYLAFPVDLVPDVIPVLGYADDAVLVVLVLRSVLRRAGAEALRRHWPGTPDGLEAVLRLVGQRVG
jgi:uncharacterized membrane protein YkvA (DUF1232 family)